MKGHEDGSRYLIQGSPLVFVFFFRERHAEARHCLALLAVPRSTRSPPISPPLTPAEHSTGEYKRKTHKLPCKPHGCHLLLDPPRSRPPARLHQHPPNSINKPTNGTTFTAAQHRHLRISITHQRASYRSRVHSNACRLRNKQPLVGRCRQNRY